MLSPHGFPSRGVGLHVGGRLNLLLVEERAVAPIFSFHRNLVELNRDLVIGIWKFEINFGDKSVQKRSDLVSRSTYFSKFRLLSGFFEIS